MFAVSRRLRPLSIACLACLPLSGLACGQGGKDGPAAAAASTVDPALHCVVEYQSADALGLVGQGDGTLSSGVDATSTTSPYALHLRSAPGGGGADLSVEATLTGPAGALAYTLLSRAAFSGEKYAFELGAQIPRVHAMGYDGHDHDFDGLRAYCAIAGTPGGPPPAGADGGAHGSLDAKYFDPELPAEGFFRRQNPDPNKVSLERLDTLLAKAAQQGSDSVIIAQDDVIIAEKYFGKGAQLAPIMSVTKSVTSLAIGALIDEGKITSVDLPLSTWFADWNTAPKNAATLRHLLTMTAGVVDTADFWNHDDLVAYVKSLPLQTTPGTTFSYSNASAMLFSGVISSAAGMQAADYVKQKFFTPIGITDAFWASDGAGNTQTPGGLSMTPLDLLRLGTLVAHGGKWEGTQLVSSSWLATSTANQTTTEACYGFLWWVVREGCDGYHFGEASPSSPVQGAFMDGWGGNYVTVIPESHVVAIRTRFPGYEATVDDELRTRYLGFTQDAAGLGTH